MNPQNTEPNTEPLERPKRKDPQEYGAHPKWEKGQSGNPGGRPKKKWLTEIYEELLDEIAETPDQREALKESLRQKLMAKGVVSTMLIQQMQDRTEGKVSQPVELEIVGLAERLKKARERRNQR